MQTVKKIYTLIIIVIPLAILILYPFLKDESRYYPSDIMKNNYDEKILHSRIDSLTEYIQKNNFNKDILLQRGFAQLKLTQDWELRYDAQYLDMIKNLDSSNWPGAFKGLKNALEDFNAVLKMDPNNPQALLGKGIIYLLVQKFEEAEDCLNKSIKIDSTNSLAFSNRGYCYLSKNLDDSALIDYNKAIELDPEYGYLYYYRSFLAKSDPEAVFYLKKALNSGYQDTTFIYRVINADLIIRKKYIEALYYSDFLHKKYPEENTYLINLGFIYKNLGLNYTAIHYYSKIIELDSGYVWPIYNIAQCYAQLKRYDQAVQYLDKFLKIENADDMDLDEVFKNCEKEIAFKEFIKTDEYLLLKKKYLN